LAIEWVRDHVAAWGGDPDRITIFGQSSGGKQFRFVQLTIIANDFLGLAVGMQLLAYGGTKPLPFRSGICESQALEPGITGNFSIDAMKRLIDYLGCNSTDLHSPGTITCLRQFDTETLFNASSETYLGDIAHNIGDIWLPVVDGDFIPAPPSQLVREGRIGKAGYTIGWTEGDVNFFTDPSIATAADTTNFIQTYLPAMPSSVVSELLALYPVAEFAPPSGTNLTAEFYRSARIFRDIIMVCQPIYLAEAANRKFGEVWLYEWNQTILEPIIEQITNISHMGVVHTSEFAYIFANFSHWNISDYPLHPTQDDYTLQIRASRTWAFFATEGEMQQKGVDHGPTVAIAGWDGAYSVEKNNTALYVIGGPHDALWTFDGENSTEGVQSQRLRERCAFINSPRVIEYLQY
jgi:carboxylesterase type B